MTNEQKLWQKIDELEAELSYHEKHLLSGDGVKCPCCDRVRHVDDSFKSQLTELFYCSDECRSRAHTEFLSDESEHEEYKASVDHALRTR